MTPSDSRLYDVLNLAAAAISRTCLGCPVDADAAWLQACNASDGLFPPGSAENDAVSVILCAAIPGREGSAERSLLFNALDAAAVAVLPAEAGDPDSTVIALRDATTAACMDGLPAQWQDALKVLADAIEVIAVTGATA
jgi:hypothetical protein